MSVKINLYMSPDLYKRLEAYLKHTQDNRSGFIRKCIITALEAEEF